ncbi:MAG: TonB-dependent receptor [Acidobacteriota bacterium]
MLFWLLSWGTVSPAAAQSSTGTISGTVKDPTGAVIPNATITIVHLQTNRQVTATTTDRGQYVSLPLSVGSYRVEAALAGFKRAVRSGVTLEVQQNAQVDLTLEVGELAERVEVTANAPLLEATTATLGKVVDNRRILELPLNTRNVYDLVRLTPGIAGSISARFDGMNWSAYGTRRRSMDIVIDGATATHPTVTGYSAITVFPSVDAIQEFKVIGAGVPAEFGRSLGTVLNVVYKSGSNDVHGSAYDFLRNSVFDANDFFANRRGEKLTSFKRNQFGGVASGPIRKNKTFFMASYEGLRERRLTSRISSVPTLRERRGDFSETLARTGQQVRIFDPFSTRANPAGGFLRDAFAGNLIPQARINPVGANVIGYFPLPNQPGDPFTGRNNYARSGSNAFNTDNYDFRVDHQISAAQKFFARYSQRQLRDDPAVLFPEELTIAEGRVVNEDRAKNVVAEHSHALSGTTVLTTRLSYSRTFFPYLNEGIGFAPSKLGFPQAIDTFGDQVMFPTFGASGYVSLGHRDHRLNAGNTYTAASSLAQIRGSHTLKFGFEGRLFRSNTTELRAPSGEFQFTEAFTQGPDPLRASSTAGNSIASLLLGAGRSGDRLFTKYKDVAAQSYYLAGYAQDDWRITPKLTLNLGLRYDLDTPRTERFNRLNYFDPAVRSPLAGKVPGFPDLRGGLVYVGVGDQGRHQYHWDARNVSPRLGAAYRLTARSVIRAGYTHIYAASFKAASGTDTPYGFRGETPWISTLDGITPLNLLTNPYPNGLTAPRGSVDGLLSAVGEGFRPKFQDDKVPWSQQWNVTIQQELPAQVLVEIGWVGTRGRELALERYANQLDPKHMALGSRLNQLVDNPFYAVLPRGILAGARVRQAQLLRPFPQFDELLGARDTGGSSWYNGLLASARKRMAHGLEIEASYTFSKTLDVGEDTTQNEYDRMASRAVAAIDITHRFVMSWVYELPFGPGRPWGGDAPRALQWLAGGWQFNGIATLQSGAPVAITASNTAGIFNPRTSANNNGSSGRLPGPAQPRLQRWLDTSVFSQPEPFRFGTAGTRIADIRAHGVSNFDLSLFKEFRPLEKLRTQFRLEALNAFNRPQFSGPNASVTSTSFGQVTGQANAPRQLQFGLKLLW